MKKLFVIVIMFGVICGTLYGQTVNKFAESKKYFENVDLNKLKQAVEKNSADISVLNKMSNIINPSSFSSANRGFDKSVFFKTSDVSLEQLLSFNKLNEEVGGLAKVKWNSKNGTLALVSIEVPDKKLNKTTMNLEGRKTAAISFLSRHKNILKLNKPEKELIVEQVDVEDNGLTHIRYQQYYKNVKVWGSYVVVHLNAGGDVQCINGSYESTPVSLSEAVFKIAEDAALLKAKTDMNYSGRYYSDARAEKIIYYDQNNKPFLAYFIELKPTMIDDFYYFIDGINGNILRKYNNTKTDGPVNGSGTDLLGKTRNLNLFLKSSQYYLIDASKDMFNSAGSTIPDDPKGAITILDLKNADHTQNSKFYFISSNSSTNWSQNAVSLAYALSTSYDYYKNIHGIKSWDNNGMNVYGIINLGSNYLNAYSTGPALFFGNGDNVQYQDFTRALDIIGHEYGHSITTYHSNLEYQYQSGALNEAFSDYSGAMIEYYDRPASFNWLIAEDAVVPSYGKVAGRDMSNPANPQVMDQLPTKMSEYMTLSADQDNGGVHINCGIPSRAFYLIAQSIGRDKMEKIIYRAYTKYLTQKSQFIDLRIAAIQSAKDLYPGAGYETQVGAAFDVVEIFDGNGTSAPEEIPAVSGQDYILMLANDGTIYRAKSTIPYDQSSLFNFGLLAKNKPSITENGAFITYVGKDNNIYLIDVAASKFYSITTDGKWHNVAVSPKGEYIAAIPDPYYEPSKIYILSTATSTVETKTLYIPNTSENSAVTYAYYADIVDFSVDGSYFLYDCYSIKTLESGNLLDTWEIMLMQRSNGTIVRVFPPQADGIMVGNPSFANTKPNLLAFDLIDARDQSNQKCYVSTYNMFSGELGLINNNFNWIGHPSFSPDDKKVVFQTKASNGISTNLSQITMSSDGLNALSTSLTGFITNAFTPVWYATGSRPVSIEENKNSVPNAYELMNSYPNPFNSTATIKYYLPKYTNIKVEIYNVLGVKVKELFSGKQDQGYHNLQWNANNVSSGTYYCRLVSPETTKIVKLVLIK